MRILLSSLALLLFAHLRAKEKTLTLEEAVTSWSIYPERLYQASWNEANRSLVYFDDSSRQFMKASTSGETAIAFKTADMASFLGEDPIYVEILDWASEHEFLFSFQGRVYQYDCASKSGRMVMELPEGSENPDLNLASGHLAYTVENNLYLQAMDGPPVAVTDHREESAVVSGQWIAREEFGITKGTFWNPEGSALAFYERDESEVGQYPLVHGEVRPGPPEMVRHPMAGLTSEASRVRVYHLASKKVVSLNSDQEPDAYLTNVGWTPDGKFVTVAELNRGQDHLKLKLYDATNGELVRLLHEERNDRWVEPEHPAYFISNREYLWLSEKDGFMNLYQGSIDQPGLTPVTRHPWVVQDIIAYDPGKSVVYYHGTGPSALERHAYATSLKKGQTRKLTPEPGVHQVAISSDFKAYYDDYSSMTVAGHSCLKSIKGKKLAVLCDSEDPLASMRSGKVELLELRASDGTLLHARMVKPSDFNPDRKYPVLVYVYGGPHAQLIQNRWNGSASPWMNWMAEQGYLVFSLDNRGSENRGFAFESAIHRQLGTLELEDQLTGLEYLRSLPYVNGEQIAVYGVSYGGFMTLTMMLKAPGEFTVGVAEAPVTDWRFYEVMYGERYMDTPRENPEGYRESSLLDKAARLEGELLLIHSTADPVVVLQHSLSLITSFVEAGKQVDFFPYPGHQHKIRGRDRLHLMTKSLNFILEHNPPSEN